MLVTRAEDVRHEDHSSGDSEESYYDEEEERIPRDSLEGIVMPQIYADWERNQLDRLFETFQQEFNPFEYDFAANDVHPDAYLHVDGHVMNPRNDADGAL